MIILGSKVKERQLGSGVFFCPRCQAEWTYSHLRVSEYFTLYFIPLFPTQTLGQYVRCLRCGGEFPETILTRTREEILRATQPWTCPLCRNRNPHAEARCVACGAARAQLPPLASDLPPQIPTPRLIAPPIIPRTAPPPKQRGPLAKALIAAGCLAGVCLIGFIGLRVYQFARFLSRPSGPTPSGELYSATSQIGLHGKPASGNSDQAVGLAVKMALAMTVLRDEQFTQSTKKSSIDQGDTFKVYCELRPGQCVFLVHVPELRRFQGEAQKTLGDLAWKAAREVLETGGITNQPIRLAVGIRGNIAYERVILGRFVPGSGQANLLPPEVEEGFGCERRLIEWFTPVDTNPGSAVEAEAKKTAP